MTPPSSGSPAGALRLAHLSDLHFGRIDAALPDRLAAEVEGVGPDLVVVSGDLTMAGRRREFRAARRFLDRLTAPIMVVPGNHDIPVYNLPARFFAPFARFDHYIGGGRQPLVDLPGVRLIGLNTVRSGGPYADWSLGRVSLWQQAWVERACAEAPAGVLKVLVLHHPVSDIDSIRSIHWTPRSREAVERFARAGIDLILAGHRHVAWTDIVPSRTGSMIMSLAPTGLSTRRRGFDNGFTVIDLGTDWMMFSLVGLNGVPAHREARITAVKGPAGWRLEPV